MRLQEFGYRLRRAWRGMFPDPRLHYGNGGSVRDAGDLEVQLDDHGRVIAVWFRNALLPFRARTIPFEHAQRLTRLYRHPSARIVGIDFEEPPLKVFGLLRRIR